MSTEQTVRDENGVMKAFSSPVGIENFNVCMRMLVHDLIDLSQTVPSIAKLLKFYGIEYYKGAFTLALPRLKVLEPRFQVLEEKGGCSMNGMKMGSCVKGGNGSKKKKKKK